MKTGKTNKGRKNINLDKKLRQEWLDFIGGEYCPCYICGKWCRWVVGHIKGKLGLSRRHEKQCTEPICAICNDEANGMTKVFQEKKKQEIGEDAFNKLMLIRVRHTTDK